MRGPSGICFRAFAAVFALAWAGAALAQPTHAAQAAKLQVIQHAQHLATTLVAPVTTTTQTTAPSEPAPVQAVIPATTEWAPTHVQVQSGGRLQIDAAEGRWTVYGQAAGAQLAANGLAFTNADGFAGRTNPEALLAAANLGALIGKIGENGTPFLVGSKYDQTANADGPLFLAINDVHGQYQENSGRMPVQILFTAPPPPNTTTATTTSATTTSATTTSTSTTPAGVTTDTSPSPVITDQQPQPPRPSGPHYPSWLAPVVAVCVVLLLLAFAWPRPKLKNSAETQGKPARAGVGTRIVSDGRANQKLSVSWKDNT